MNNLTFKKIASFLTLTIVLASTAYSQTSSTSQTKKDHCGSTFTEKLVPENLMGCNMAEACKAHDVCYGACDPGGSKYGTDYCQQSEFSTERVQAKKACDTQFYVDILQKNNNKWQCKAFGAMYTSAVVLAGQGPFNGMPIPPQAMRDLVQTSNSPAEAAAKFEATIKINQGKNLQQNQFQRANNVLTISPATSTAENSNLLVLKRGMSNTDIAEAIRKQQKLQGLPSRQ